MKYFDALYTVTKRSNPDFAYYYVTSIAAETKEEATRKAKRKRGLGYAGPGGYEYIVRFWTVGVSGSLDHFVSRNVGDFIDEVFPCLSNKNS